MSSTAVLAAVRPPATKLHVHVHLPRTAGSALQRTWVERGGWFLRLPLDEAAGTPERIAEQLRGAVAERRPVLVGGHLPYRLLRPAVQDGDVVYAAVREPVERAASLYRYARSMCQGRDIVNYPGDAAVRTRWNADWRTNVAARGLDPDDFTLAQFVAAGLCPDDDYRAYFAASDATTPEDLGQEMRGNGFVVLQGRTARRLLGERPVNRTVSGDAVVDGADRELLQSHLARDVVAHAAVLDAFAPRRPVRTLGRLTGRVTAAARG